MVRKTVGARELKNRLGTYLRQVREGVTIVVTDRGRPVAELRRVSRGETDEEVRLDELVAAGLLAPRLSSDAVGKARPLRLDGGSLAEAIVEGREDRL